MRDLLAESNSERARATSINELGRLHQRRDLADTAIMHGWSLDLFQQSLMQEIAPERRASTAVGLTARETQQYSILRMLGHLSTHPHARGGLELEASQAVAKAIGREPTPGGFFVPLEVLQRDLTVSGSAGVLVSSNIVPGSFTGALYSRSVVRRMGATFLPGLKGNLPLPKQKNTGTAYWLGTEATQITAGDQTFGTVNMTPHHVGALTRISAQLANQSTPEAESVVMTDLSTVVALAVDKAAMQGPGVSGQPLGIIGTTGIHTVTGTSLDYAKCLEFQSDLLGSNAMVNPTTCGYATTTAVAKLLAGRQRFTGSDATLWQGNLADGEIAGMRAMSSEQLPTGHMIFGDWSQLVVADWGVLELATDPFSGNNFTERKITVRAWYMVDTGVRHEESFSVATAVT
jgi:HK97 family phage major capsid protein